MKQFARATTVTEAATADLTDVLTYALKDEPSLAAGSSEKAFAVYRNGFNLVVNLQPHLPKTTPSSRWLMTGLERLRYSSPHSGRKILVSRPRMLATGTPPQTRESHE